MSLLAEFGKLEMVTFIGLLFAIVVVKLLTGAINTRHLLFSKELQGAGHISSARVQLLVSTMAGAATYLAEALEHADKHELLNVPVELLLLVGGSQAIYLGGKAYSRIRWRQLFSTLLVGGIR